MSVILHSLSLVLPTEVMADGLSLPTTMTFLSQNDILVLENDKGTVMRVIGGEVRTSALVGCQCGN